MNRCLRGPQKQVHLEIVEISSRNVQRLGNSAGRGNRAGDAGLGIDRECRRALSDVDFAEAVRILSVKEEVQIQSNVFEVISRNGNEARFNRHLYGARLAELFQKVDEL